MPAHADGTIAHQRGGLLTVEHHRHHRFRHHQIPDGAEVAVTGFQTGHGGIGIGRKHHPRHVRHFTQQRFGQAGVLMALFVFAVFPHMGGRNHRHAQPGSRFIGVFLMARENDALTQCTQHFGGEGFVRHHQIQARLIGQTSAHHGLFVQRSNHAAIHRLRHALFRFGNAVLEQVEGLVHAVGTELIGVADAYAQMRIHFH